MTRDYAVFLRNNRNPSMEQLRAALAGLGLTDVESFGSSGNFVFCSTQPDAAVLEARISEALGATALVRDRQQVAAIATNDPYADGPGAELFLTRQPVDHTSLLFRNALGPDGDPPIASGTTIYFRNPTRLPGKKAIVDFERELSVTGTRRTSRVIARVLDMM